MNGNQSLQEELARSLENIRKKIEAHDPVLYKNELNQLNTDIDNFFNASQQNSIFEKIDLGKSIMKIINKIDEATKSLETEMHGVTNYSEEVLNQIKGIEFQQAIKKDLNGMLNRVIAARPDRRETEVPKAIMGRLE